MPVPLPPSVPPSHQSALPFLNTAMDPPENDGARMRRQLDEAKASKRKAQKEQQARDEASPEISSTPTPQNASPYASLPSPPIDMARLRGSLMGTNHGPDYPFPCYSLPTPPSDGTTSPASETASPTGINTPVWPDPASYSVAPASRASLRHTETHHHRTAHPALSPSISHALKPRSLLSSRLQRFEVALVDRLAEFLEQDDTIATIRDTTGVLTAELVGVPGHRRFVCEGSPSCVNKARQLVDARLGLTPLRIRFSVRLPASPCILSFSPWTATTRVNGETVSLPLHRFVTSPPFSPPSPSRERAIRPPLGTRTSSTPSSFHAFFHNGRIGPFRTLSSSSSNATPSSERSADSFFSALSSPSASSPGPSPSVFSSDAGSIRLVGLSDSPEDLPQVGSFEAHRTEYINAVVDELAACVDRRSLARVKVVFGQQGWILYDAEKGVGVSGEDGWKGWQMSEVESSFKVDASRPFAAPHYQYDMSEKAVLGLVERLKSHGFTLKKEKSHVHIHHLDCPRAVYAVATAEIRGHDIRNLPPGQGATGGLALKKVSTLPSKPFSLSITTPGTVEASDAGPVVRLREGSDMRVKVLADKAATSPSLELSKALQTATWEVDADQVFRCHIELDPTRFSPSQTSIKWNAKEKWENGTFRATRSENRQSGSATSTFEFEVNSQELNAELVELSYNQLRKKFNRERIAKLVGELVTFAEGLVGEVRMGEAPAEAVVEALRGLSVAGGMVGEGVSPPLGSHSPTPL